MNREKTFDIITNLLCAVIKRVISVHIFPVTRGVWYTFRLGGRRCDLPEFLNLPRIWSKSGGQFYRLSSSQIDPPVSDHTKIA